MFIPCESKTIKTRILEYAKTKGVLLGQFRYLHTDILTLVINCKPDSATECRRYP